MIERDRIEATKGEKVRRTFQERLKAEKIVEQLHDAGFNDDQISLMTHGGHTEPDGSFVPGGVEVVVLADDRADEAERILAQ
jgi:hypothetical protein